MNEKGALAKQYFLEGYNCAQAVLLAFAEELGLDEKTALRLSSSFGGGMGRMREVCGAVSALFLVAGALYGYDDPQDQQAKQQHYALIRTLAEQFKEQNGSIVCRELLGMADNGSSVPEARTAAYYQKRPCKDLVEMAAELAEKMIREKEEAN